MSSGCTCRLTPTRCCRSPITACAAATTSTSSSPASSPPCSTWTWNRPSSTAPKASVWDWASNDRGHEPDVVMACAGDVPTLETLAAVSILRQELPDLHVRLVNVVDLMALQPPSEHPHGISDAE